MANFDMIGVSPSVRRELLDLKKKWKKHSVNEVVEELLKTQDYFDDPYNMKEESNE